MARHICSEGSTAPRGYPGDVAWFGNMDDPNALGYVTWWNPESRGWSYRAKPGIKIDPVEEPDKEDRVMMTASEFINGDWPARRCRECGVVEELPNFSSPQGGYVPFWVAEDLCSRCSNDMIHIIIKAVADDSVMVDDWVSALGFPEKALAHARAADESGVKWKIVIAGKKDQVVLCGGPS